MCIAVVDIVVCGGMLKWCNRNVKFFENIDLIFDTGTFCCKNI